jgi:hypothetical protein
MNKKKLKEGDIVQITPDRGHRFGGFFCIVMEPKDWGCMGYLVHHTNFDAVRIVDTEQAYVRLAFEEIEYCGNAFWLLKREEDLAIETNKC